MINKDTYKRLTERYIDEQGINCVRGLAWDGEILHSLAELEDRIKNGTLIELPRIIHPNEQEWFVQYQYESGIIDCNVFYSEAEAEAKLKELQEKEK